jgi:hypothetical protein
MKCASLAGMFGGFKMMIERNERNTLEQFVTCSHPYERNERNTPLEGVTSVTQGQLDLVAQGGEMLNRKYAPIPSLFLALDQLGGPTIR